MAFTFNLHPSPSLGVEEKQIMENPKSSAEELARMGKGADRTIKKHALASAGIGLIPLPIIDLVALTGIQLNMLKKLAQEYNIPFSKNMGISIVSSLFGGIIPVVHSGILTSLVKAIPVVGQPAGLFAAPALSGAVTYAVGKVFMQHFASGGTFLNFNPEEVRAYYEEMFREGKQFVAEAKREVED